MKRTYFLVYFTNKTKTLMSENIKHICICLLIIFVFVFWSNLYLSSDQICICLLKHHLRNMSFHIKIFSQFVVRVWSFSFWNQFVQKYIWHFHNIFNNLSKTIYLTMVMMPNRASWIVMSILPSEASVGATLYWILKSKVAVWGSFEGKHLFNTERLG